MTSRSTLSFAPVLPHASPAANAHKPARRARVRSRHWKLLLSFLVLVFFPIALSALYLWGRAADQFASTVGFSVRQEEQSSALDILGRGFAGFSGSSSSDTDILYEYLQSQKLVQVIDDDLNLRRIWTTETNDFLFGLAKNGSVEDLLGYWPRMVQVFYDRSAGLIEVRARAFSPNDATSIAQKLFERSSEMINDLSAIAREDAISYAWEELQIAKDRLSSARKAVLVFRNRHQLVDPSIDVATQSNLIGSLQAQLAEALISLDLLKNTTVATDPRQQEAALRIKVIESRLAAERKKLGEGSHSLRGTDYAHLIGEFESLIVDREFAEKTYVSALATYDASLADARRKSRYLAAYMQPTKAETALFPNRGLVLGLVALCLGLLWSIGALVVWSAKDRR